MPKDNGKHPVEEISAVVALISVDDEIHCYLVTQLVQHSDMVSDQLMLR